MELLLVRDLATRGVLTGTLALVLAVWDFTQSETGITITEGGSVLAAPTGFTAPGRIPYGLVT